MRGGSRSAAKGPGQPSESLSALTAAAAPPRRYFFGHGHDYEGALADYRSVAGRIPLLPRWELGPQYSRWFAYHDFEEREIVSSFGRHGIPLSVQIVDMDFHDSYPRGVPNVPDGLLPHELEPWTGFTVWKDLFPSMSDLIAFFHARGVRTLFNLHPHFGVQFYDAM